MTARMGWQKSVKSIARIKGEGMRIKVCGLKREENIDYVNQLMRDWIGFVFAGTKRRIDSKRAIALKL